MRKINIWLFLVLILLNVTILNAQIRKIPASVTETFKQKYPTATNVEWKDKLTEFQAGFKWDGDSYLSKFSNKGEWEQTEKAMGVDKIPPAVNDGLQKSKYSDRDIKSVTQITYKDNHIEYRILVRKSDIEKKYLFFDETGKLIRDSITL